MGRHDALLGNVILIMSLSVFTLTPGIVFGLTRWRLELTIYHSRIKYANHLYTTDATMFDFTWNYVLKIE